MFICVCVSVCVCVYVCPKRVFRGLDFPTFRYCEVILYSEVLLPRSFSKPPLSSGIAFRNPLSKFWAKTSEYRCYTPPV